MTQAQSKYGSTEWWAINSGTTVRVVQGRRRAFDTALGMIGEEIGTLVPSSRAEASKWLEFEGDAPINTSLDFHCTTGLSGYLTRVEDPESAPL